MKESERLRINRRNFIRTPFGHITSIYWAQVNRSRKKGLPDPLYSTSELRDKYVKDSKFVELFESYEKSGFKRLLAPSFDRLDDSKGYSFSNIQLMTCGENLEKSYRDMRSGKLTHGNKPQKRVEQLTTEGIFISEFPSASEAQRVTGISRTAINNCLKKLSKTSGGYIWKYL